MDHGVRDGRRHPHGQIRIPNPCRRTRQQRPKLVKQWCVGRRDVGITKLWQFLAEDALQFRIHGVCRHTHRYQRSQRRLEIVAAALDQDLSDRPALLFAVPTPEFRNDGVLARKILIERRDVDAGALGDAVRRQTPGPLAHQNVSCGLQDGLDGLSRTLLLWPLSWRKPQSTWRCSFQHECKLTKISVCLHYKGMADRLLERRVAYAQWAGGPDVLQVAVEPLAHPNVGEVLVRVEAAGLNHVESLVRTGTYSVRIPFPYAAGLEGAGVVVACGPDVDLTPGTRVCWTAVFGSCATFVVAPAAMFARLPDSLTFEDGASLAHAAITAAGLVRHWPLERGSFAVVWGAAGAVGSVLVASLAERGVKVMGIASGARVEAARAAGAALVVDRTSEDVPDAVRVATDGRGASAVFDPIGTATYRTNLKLLAPRGCLINYGQLSGSLPAIDLAELMDAGSVFVTKYGPRAGVVGRSEVGTLVSEALTLASKRRLACRIAARFALDRVVDAYRRLESNPDGKVLVLPHSV